MLSLRASLSGTGGWCCHGPHGEEVGVLTVGGLTVRQVQEVGVDTSSGRLELSPVDSLPTSLDCCSQRRPGANLDSERDVPD